MQLEQLEYVLEVAQCNSINAAAKNLFMSQPSLSQSIKNLEAELGVELFERTSQGARLTNEGADFAEYARRVLEQKDLLESHFRDSNRGRRTFRVSSLRSTVVAPAFATFVKEQEQQLGAADYCFTICGCPVPRVIDDVQSRRSELGVVVLPESRQEAFEKSLAKAELAAEEITIGTLDVLLGEGHPLAGAAEVSADDLAPYPQLRFEEGSTRDAATWRATDLNGAIFSFTAEKELIASDWASAPELFEICNAYLLTTDFEQKIAPAANTVRVPYAPRQAVRLMVVYSPKRPLTAMQQRFIELLRVFVKQRCH